VRVLTLRARVPGARPIELHRRITVLAHVSPGDRDALRSTFAALTEPAVPGLEAVLQIQDTTVPLDDAFARTYGLLEAPSAVVDVPAAASGAQGVEPPAAFANTASSASLRVKRDNLRSELTSTRRAIEEEKLYRVGRDSRSEGAVHRGLR
jgi:hypothetical protein